MCQIIKVAHDSPVPGVAGAIAKLLRQECCVAVQAIGLDAVNRAIKGLIVARVYLHQDHLDLLAAPEFTEVDIDGAVHTAIRFSVHRISVPAG